MDSKKNNNYYNLILKHGLEPYNYGSLSLSEKTHYINGKNEECGDIIHFYAIIKQNYIEKLNFLCYGCTLSKASSSILVKEIEKKSLLDSLNFINIFFKEFSNKNNKNSLLGEASILLNLNNYINRVNCIFLGWNLLHKMLINELNKI